jgi:hypothetical protein
MFPNSRASGRPVVTSALLHGWEEVAAYLGVTSRTARRWHARRAMPLIRKRWEVSTTRNALEQWYLALPLVEGTRHTVPQACCPHCGLRPSDAPRPRPPAGSASPSPNPPSVQVE